MHRLKGISLFRWLLIGGGVLLLIFLVYPRSSGLPERDISHVIQLAESKSLTKIRVEGDKLEVSTIDGDTFRPRKERSVSIFDLLSKRGIDPVASAIQIEVQGESSSVRSIQLGYCHFLSLAG